MEFGLSFPASPQAARQAQHAEALGFSSIGFFDSPALETDVWITVASAVEATSRIKVGTEILVPHLRHPMAQACAIATIEQLGPGRLFVGVGTGFTGRRAIGQPPLSSASMSSFLKCVRGLLAGEDVVIDGAITRMLQPSGFAPPRPIRVPLLVAANGPKGIAVARELGDGLIYGGAAEAVPSGFAMLQLGVGGILLDSGEAPDSPRALERAKMLFALQYHLAYDGYNNPPLPADHLPHGGEWLEMIAQFPPATRHLHVHDLHMVGTNAHDLAFIEQYPDTVVEFAVAAALRPEQLRERVDATAAMGATRISCGAAYADWERDMERYAAALLL